MRPIDRLGTDLRIDMCISEEGLTRRQYFSLMGAALLLSRFRPRAEQLIDVGGGLKIHPRSEWGADLPPKGVLQPEENVKFLLVHHTAGTTNYAPNAVAQLIRNTYTFHTGSEKGWNDVCYNFFIDRYGGVWEGREGSLQGPVMADATGGSQGFAQLVCLLGNFQENTPTPEMISALERLLGWLAQRYEIDPTPGSTVSFISRGSNKWPSGSEVVARTISGHRDMSLTACPGDFVYPLLASSVPTNVTNLAAPLSNSTVSTPSTIEPSVDSTTSSTSQPTIESTSPPSESSTSVASPTTSISPTDPETADTDSGFMTAAKIVAISAAAVGTVATGASIIHREKNPQP